MIIAIDGPAGSGKSSTAKLVAKALNALHLDTGAMYRAITLKCLRLGIPVASENVISEMMAKTSISFTGSPPDTRIWLDGEDVSAAIRGDDVTKNVSDYCAVPIVRRDLVKLQRSIPVGKNVVCEGRDIGTVVFPDADLKFYMVASIDARARRRLLDFERLNVKKDLNELMAEIAERDKKDSSRELSPLRRAPEAEQIDTTNMTLDQQVQHIVAKARKKIVA